MFLSLSTCRPRVLDLNCMSSAVGKRIHLPLPPQHFPAAGRRRYVAKSDAKWKKRKEEGRALVLNLLLRRRFDSRLHSLVAGERVGCCGQASERAKRRSVYCEHTADPPLSFLRVSPIAAARPPPLPLVRPSAHSPLARSLVLPTENLREHLPVVWSLLARFRKRTARRSPRVL